MSLLVLKGPVVPWSAPFVWSMLKRYSPVVSSTAQMDDGKMYGDVMGPGRKPRGSASAGVSGMY